MHGSRRTANLQPSDYDHEITIMDGEEVQSLQAASYEGGELVPTNTSTRSLLYRGAETEDNQEQSSERGEREHRDQSHLHPSASKGKGGGTTIYQLNTSETNSDLGPSRSGARPSIEIRGRLRTYFTFRQRAG